MLVAIVWLVLFWVVLQRRLRLLEGALLHNFGWRPDHQTPLAELTVLEETEATGVLPQRDEILGKLASDCVFSATHHGARGELSVGGLS